MSLDSWCLIESDPGAFTEMVEDLGVKAIEIDEVLTLEPESWGDLGKIHGLIFLFDIIDGNTINDGILKNDKDIFFAKQVVPNACATQAILSILMNSEKIELGNEMIQFKEFTMDLPPEMRGLAISNSTLIRQVHNSFSPNHAYVNNINMHESDKGSNYHFISLCPIKGQVYELDGLLDGPIAHEISGTQSWTTAAAKIIQNKIKIYGENGKFTLLAVIDSRITHLQTQKNDLLKQLENDYTNNEEIQSKIADITQQIITEEEKHARYKRISAENTALFPLLWRCLNL